VDHATGPARFGIAKPAGGSIRNGVCHPAKCSIAGRPRNRRATGRWKRMSNDALNDRHPGEFSSPDDIRSRGQILRDRLRRRRTHRSDNVHGGGRTALKALRGDDTRITNSLRHHIAIGQVVHHNVADDRFTSGRCGHVCEIRRPCRQSRQERHSKRLACIVMSAICHDDTTTGRAFQALQTEVDRGL